MTRIRGSTSVPMVEIGDVLIQDPAEVQLVEDVHLMSMSENFSLETGSRLEPR